MFHSIKRMTVALLLIACLTMPATAFAEYKIGDVGTIGDVSGNTDIQVGESDSETSINTGSSVAATESTAAVNNRESSREIGDLFKDIASTGGQFGITTDSGYVFSENIAVTKEWLQKILDAANYTDGENYNKTSKGANGVTASQEDLISLRNILNNDKATLQNKGIFLSDSFADFPFDFDLLQGQWPEAYDPTGQVSEIIEKWLTSKDGFEIYLGGGLVMVDFDKLSDRYQALQDYLDLNATSITDTLTVQHVTEYVITNTSSAVKYSERQIPYGSGGLYSWSVSVTDDGVFVGSQSNIPNQTGEQMHWRFGCAGDHVFTRYSLRQSSFVQTLTFSQNEYWIIPETGQVIYSKITNGRLGDTDTPDGRQSDRNTAYYMATVTIEEVADQFTAYVTDDMVEDSLGTTRIGNAIYSTTRIE